MVVRIRAFGRARRHHQPKRNRMSENHNAAGAARAAPDANVADDPSARKVVPFDADNPTPTQLARREARQAERERIRREEAKIKADAWAKAKADAWIREKAERHEKRQAEQRAERQRRKRAAEEAAKAKTNQNANAQPGKTGKAKPSRPGNAKPSRPGNAKPAQAAKAKPAQAAKAKRDAQARGAPDAVARVGPNAAPSAVPQPLPIPVGLAQRVPRKRRAPVGTILFLFLVLVPTAVVGYYYATMATPQYRSEMSFAVRGTQASPLSTLGFTALPGADTEAPDAYIVIKYLKSLQLLKDLQTQRNMDLRLFFAQRWIDPVYRIDADMPLEEFHAYWNWMIDADYNSTTAITSFQVNAFTSSDAEAITKAALAAATRLVNELSQEVQSQLIRTATEQVQRTEDRLAEARAALTRFRNQEQSLDPTLQAQSDQTLIQGIEKEIIDLRARRAALLASVSASSPSVRVIDRQLRSLESELTSRRQIIGSGDDNATGAERTTNRSAQLGTFDRLNVELEFAEKAYTTALASLEQSQAEARKQERYFAIVVSPTKPSVPLYPLSIVNTLLAFVAFFMLWLVIYLVVQNVRDHSI